MPLSYGRCHHLIAPSLLLLVGACAAPRPAQDELSIAAVKAMLTDMHVAAAVADEERFFGHLEPDAILLGTAAEERWSVAEMRRLAAPSFARGEGWTTLPIEQHVTVSPDGSLAWFDERLQSARFGAMRGTGIARRSDGRWRIAHYNTAFVVQNERFRDLVQKIAARSARDPAAAAAAGVALPAMDAVTAAKTALLGFHTAASEADAERYFALFDPNATYLGTDPKERFTVAQFKDYVGPYLARGEGWTTLPVEQHVALSRDGSVAWFDERLESTRHGEMRGSGVLMRHGAGWRIAQYNLVLPVPNELVADVVELTGWRPR